MGGRASGVGLPFAPCPRGGGGPTNSQLNVPFPDCVLSLARVVRLLGKKPEARSAASVCPDARVRLFLSQLLLLSKQFLQYCEN